ncbi:guanylate-binding protein 2-like [Mya arenaria]|uniref:guanylate-binding protein 2-like n=1 Tax=Mya arenaria TaxID=6604 RepID=UPI0022E4462E|nr:guanylate-binding protein 2-like [Mya arenaria]
MNPNKAPPMNRPVPAPRTVLPKRESPSRGTSAMATNENPVDSPACRDFSSKLKLFDQQSKMRDTDSAGKAPSFKQPGGIRMQTSMMASTLERAEFRRELFSKVECLPAKPSHYLSMHDSKVFQEPRCLITSSAGNVLEISEDVLDEISCIDKPCVIVAVAGLYRTGKSYLMNLLAGKHTDKGFALGDTVQSKTKGIWVWCVAHPEKKDTVLILLDTEGLGDPEKGDPNHDNRIFTLAALLCSTLVYNMKGAFDRDAVDKLTFVSEMSKNIRFGGKCGEDNYLLQCVLPGFVLALRDFSLKPIMNGQKVTIDDYLEEILKSDTGKGDAFNKPRKCISNFFPKEKLRCFGFPVPGDGEVLDNLDSLTVQDLSKKFQDVASEFASYIYHQEPKKLQVSKPVNGSMFATLTRQYVEDLANAAVPDVDHRK